MSPCQLGSLSLVPLGTTVWCRRLFNGFWRYNALLLLCFLEEKSRKKLAESIVYPCTYEWQQIVLDSLLLHSWENEEFLGENVDKVWNQQMKWILIVYVKTMVSLKIYDSSFRHLSWKTNSSAIPTLSLSYIPHLKQTNERFTIRHSGNNDFSKPQGRITWVLKLLSFAVDASCSLL